MVFYLWPPISGRKLETLVRPGGRRLIIVARMDNWKIHPTGELRKALATYFAMSVSTSGVEQKFSKAQVKFHTRIAASARLEDMALKVMQDAHEYDEDRLV